VFLVHRTDLDRLRRAVLWHELDEYVALPCSPLELVLRCEAMLARAGRLLHAGDRPTLRSMAPPRHGTRVILVSSTKGGVGKTTLACNLALALRQLTEGKVVLMDGNFEFGDVAATLNLLPSSHLANLIALESRLDPEAVELVLTEHPSGVRVLAAPPEPVLGEGISAALVTETIQTLRYLADYVVIDGVSTLTDRALAMMDAADIILLTLTPEVAVLKNATLFLHVAEQLGLRDRVRVVVNRAGGPYGLTLDQISAYFGGQVVAALPSDGATVVTAANRGEPYVTMAPTTPIAQGTRRLAGALAGVAVPPLPAASRPPFGRRVSTAPVAASPLT